MKLSGIILMVLFVGFLFTSWGILVDDMETQYVNSTIIDTEPINETFKNKYDISESVNDSFSDINTELRNIESDSGWTSFLSGGVAISGAFLKLPVIVLLVMAEALGNFISIGQIVGIPATLIGILTIMVTVLLLFKLVSSLRRYDT